MRHILCPFKKQRLLEMFLNGSIRRFGVPLLLHSDQESQFESSLFQELFSLLDIDKTSKVERFNLTLENMFSKYIHELTAQIQSANDVRVRGYPGYYCKGPLQLKTQVIRFAISSRT